MGSAIEGDRDGAVDVAEHQAALVVDDLGVDGAGGAEAGIGEGQLRRAPTIWVPPGTETWHRGRGGPAGWHCVRRLSSREE